MCSVAQLCATLAIPWTVAARLCRPWDSPAKNTGAGCCGLLQGIFLTQGSNPRLLHWQVHSLPPSHQGSPLIMYIHMASKAPEFWARVERQALAAPLSPGRSQGCSAQLRLCPPGTFQALRGAPLALALESPALNAVFLLRVSLCLPPPPSSCWCFSPSTLTLRSSPRVSLPSLGVSRTLAGGPSFLPPGPAALRPLATHSALTTASLWPSPWGPWVWSRGAALSAWTVPVLAAGPGGRQAPFLLWAPRYELVFSLGAVVQVLGSTAPLVGCVLESGPRLS